MKYFVTGATGFIGGVLVRKLRSAGHEVVALVRDPNRADDLAALGIELSKGDITRRDTLPTPMKGVDGVFHMAAWYKIGVSGELAEAINVEGTRNVLETARDLDIPKVVYTSTLAVNSDTGGQMVDESYRHTGGFLSVYDQTKWKAHYEVAEPLAAAGLPLVTLMPGVVYGPGDTSMLGALVANAVAGKFVTLPGGRTGACWAHVDDVADGHVLAMEAGVPGETYIIAGPAHTYREAFGIAGKAAGRRVRAIWMPPAMLGFMSRITVPLEKVLPIPPELSSESMRVAAGTTYLGDNAKARRELGYNPRDLETGFKDTFGAPK
jgi:nucleoside-diphosphate-sugar epimerase